MRLFSRTAVAKGRILPLAALAWSLVAGCATQRFQSPDAAGTKGKKVTASLSHLSFFYLTPASNLDRLLDDLSEQCGGGRVDGISNTHTKRYIYLFGELSTYEVAGRCAE